MGPRIRGLLLAAAAGLWVAHAHAQTLSGVQTASGSAVLGGCAFAVGGAAVRAGDNGCSASRAYIADPGISEVNIGLTANFAYNTAQSGQLPNTCLSSACAEAGIRDGYIHINNEYLASIDYGVGAADPTADLTYIAPSTFSAAQTASNPCQYKTTGGHISNSPRLLCTATATGQALYINGKPVSGSCTAPPTSLTTNITGCPPIDFTNDGTGTGKTYIQLEFVGANTVSNYQWISPYFKTSGSGQVSNTGVVYAAAGAGSPPPPVIEFDNATGDGNYANAGGAVSTQFMIDNRTGPTPAAFPLIMRYSYLTNYGAQPIGGTNMGSVQLYDTRIHDICQNGNTPGTAGVHCEIALVTGVAGVSTVTSPRTDIYKDVIVDFDATQTTQVFYSSNDYLTTGQSNGAIFTSATVRDGVTVFNVTACNGTNAPPYTPSNPCLGDGVSTAIKNGNGLFAVTYDTSLAVLTIQNEVVDYSGSQFAFANENVAGGTSLAGGTSSSSEVTLTLPFSGYNNTGAAVVGILYPGNLIADTTGGTSFLPTAIASLDTYTNAGSVAAQWAGTASVASSTMTVTHTTSGALAIGMLLGGNNFLSITTITGGSGTSWTVSPSQSVASDTSAHASACVISADPGCGGLLLTNTSEPSLSYRNTWGIYANVVALVHSGNYSIGGAWVPGGQGARSLDTALAAAQPWGQVAIP